MGALHQIDFAALRNAASAWHDEFAPLQKPLLVVNIGGPTSNYSLYFESVPFFFFGSLVGFALNCQLLHVIILFFRSSCV